MPFRDQKPEEILTIANRILGSGQTSLAKFLWIAAANDHPQLSTRDLPQFFRHMLERVDWTRDLHFQTKTTIDTLDYSGSGWNAGSKVVIAACGLAIRTLSTELPADLKLTQGFTDPCIALPGVLILKGNAWKDQASAEADIQQLTNILRSQDLQSWPLIVIADDSRFTAANINNFVWVTFTRANPSHDIHGVESFTVHKHWGCRGPLIIDARIKTHHAPGLEEDPATLKKIEHLFKKGAVLEKWG